MGGPGEPQLLVLCLGADPIGTCRDLSPLCRVCVCGGGGWRWGGEQGAGSQLGGGLDSLVQVLLLWLLLDTTESCSAGTAPLCLPPSPSPVP